MSKKTTLDEHTEQKIRRIATTDLRNKSLTRELDMAELGGPRRIWNRIMGHSDHAEILEAANKLQRLSESATLSEEQKALIESAKENVRALAQSMDGRGDLANTVIAQFDGSEVDERIQTGPVVESQGLTSIEGHGAFYHDSTKPSHHPCAGFNSDRLEGAYFDNGSLAIVVCDGEKVGGIGNLFCAQETAQCFLDSLQKVVVPSELDWKALKRIFIACEQSIREGYVGDRASQDGGGVVIGRTGLAAIRTFPTADPLRVDVKVVQLGYVVVFYRNRETGQVFPLTRTERAASEPEREYTGEEDFHDSTSAVFDPAKDISTYWDNIHFNEALVPIHGDFIILTDGYLDNLLDYQTLETIINCPVFDREIAGPTPWVNLPTVRQLKKYNEVNGHQLDAPSQVSPERIVIRLNRYVHLMTKSRRGLTEEIDELVDQKAAILDEWLALVRQDAITLDQLECLKKGEAVTTSDGRAFDGSSFTSLDVEIDKLLADLEAVPGVLGDCLASAVPVFFETAKTKVNVISKTISTLFG